LGCTELRLRSRMGLLMQKGSKFGVILALLDSQPQSRIELRRRVLSAALILTVQPSFALHSTLSFVIDLLFLGTQLS
jgi:hypothetical protein